MLLLARHGQTDWNAEKRLQGRTEVPLNDAGREQARALAGALEAERAVSGRALVSPLGRARDTAAILESLLPALSFEVEPRLVELDLGDWEGRLESDLAADARYQAFRSDPLRNPAPGGEGAIDVARRVAPLLDSIAAEDPGAERILLLGHQFTNAVIQCLATGRPLDQVRSAFQPPGTIRALRLPLRRP